jgi:hypothetical protein
LAGSVYVNSVSTDATIEKTLKVSAPSFDGAFYAALTKSLRNYGYGGSQGAAGGVPSAVAIDASVGALAAASDDKGTHVSVRVRFVSSAGDAKCLPYEASGSFYALKPQKGSSGGDALAVVATLGFAAMGALPTAIITEQVSRDREQQSILNGSAPRTPDESVAPSRDADEILQFGLINALHLANRGLIAHLGESGGCNAQSAAVPEHVNVSQEH